MNKISVFLLLAITGVFFVNMGVYENESLQVKDPALLNEYIQFQNKVEQNKYGVEGGEIMKVHLRSVAHKVALTEEIYDCHGLAQYLPSHYTADYIFPKKNDKKTINGSTCLSKKDVAKHINDFIIF